MSQCFTAALLGDSKWRMHKTTKQCWYKGVFKCPESMSCMVKAGGRQTSGSTVTTHFSKPNPLFKIRFALFNSGWGAFFVSVFPFTCPPIRRWEGGDPGVSNQKTPTTILLTPDRKFHSFGYAARDFYHDLDPSESKQWLYLEKFKMKLHTTAVLTLSLTYDANTHHMH